MKLPVPAPQLSDLLSKISNIERVLDVKDPEVNGVYEHWDQLRHRTPPPGLTHEEWWAGLKIARNALLRRLPLLDKLGNPMTVAMTHTMQRKLHFLDREAAGVILGADRDDDQSIRRHHLMRSLIEEAMTSSQLEGASTTRQVAKEMLSTGRGSPTNPAAFFSKGLECRVWSKDWPSQGNALRCVGVFRPTAKASNVAI